MTVACGYALVAAALLATQAGAFVPGGLVHTPSVRVRASDPQKPTSLHLLPMTFEDRRAAVAPVPPVQAPESAIEILSSFMKDVEAAKQKSAAAGDTATVDFLQATRIELFAMAGSMARKDIDHTFALAPGTGPGAAGGGAGAAQAVATVAHRVVRDDFGKLPALAEKQGFTSKNWAQRLFTTGSEQVRVVDVTGLATRPGADPQRSAAGKELIHEIANWAATNGCLVIISEPQAMLEAYFGGMGFERINAFDTAMVYTGYGGKEDEPSAGQQFHLVTLEPEY